MKIKIIQSLYITCDKVLTDGVYAIFIMYVVKQRKSLRLRWNAACTYLVQQQQQQ